MGMAASQARLLSITARMHDVEYKAQNIMNQKVALATQKDELYQDYCDALDAKKIQVGYYGENGKLNFVDATFASVCEFNPDRAKTFMMTDSNTGKMIVSQELYDAYNNFKGNGGDKYAFALEMIGFTASEIQNTNLQSIGILLTGANYEPKDGMVTNNTNDVGGSYKNSETGKYDYYLLMDSSEATVFASHEGEESRKKLDSLMTKLEQAKEKGDKEEVKKSIDAFRTELYNKYAEEIYGSLKVETGATDLEEMDASMLQEFKYYVQMFEGIENAGGCISISEYNKDGDSGNEWFNNMVKSGKVLLSEYNDSGTKKGTWSEVSIATSQNLQEVSDDADLKKAEAKYNYELSVINRKETRFDQDLNKLETERTALNKELDSVKQVEKDNIERTFGIFS